MKAALVITNPYIEAEPFQRILRRLNDRRIQTSLYFFPRHCGGKETLPPEAAGLPFRGSPAAGVTLPAKLASLGHFIMDSLRIRRFLRRENVDLAVMGGDMTDHYGRLFLDTCRKIGIDVLLLPIAIPAPTVVNPDPDKNIPLAGLLRAVLKPFGLEKTVFFRGWVLGSYHREAMIAVPDQDVRRLLCDNGIADDRIIVTGDPSLDRLFEVRGRSPSSLRSELDPALGILHEDRIVIFCTELIQDIYGHDFLKSVLGKLGRSFDDLPENIRVVIKFHPREPEPIRALYEEIFRGRRYVFLTNTDLFRLLRSADLVLGFYSKVLIDAALLDVPVLSLRICDDGAPVRFGRVTEWTHILSEDEIAGKIKAALFDESFRRSLVSFLSTWRNRAGYLLDGKNCDRVTELIVQRLHS